MCDDEQSVLRAGAGHQSNADLIKNSRDEACRPQAGNEHPGCAVGADRQVIQRLGGEQVERGRGSFRAGPVIAHKKASHLRACLPPLAAAAQHALKCKFARALHQSSSTSLPWSCPHLAGHRRARHLAPPQLLRDPGCTMWIARGTRVETSQGAAANGLADGLGCWAAADLRSLCAHQITKWPSSPGAPGEPAPVPPLSPCHAPSIAPRS